MSIAGRRLQKATKVSGPSLPAGGYLTILFSRVCYQALVGGNPIAGKTKTIFDAADELSSRGLWGCGAVVIDRTEESTRKNFSNFYASCSWDDIANLRDNYNWKFVSQGMHYDNMTTFTNNTQRYNESGATLPIFEAHGHNDAWGVFCYPNNKQDAAARAVVNQHFAFGRSYSVYGATNTQPVVTTSPYVLKTWSINGGRCNNTGLACNTMTITPEDRLTDSPVEIADHMSPPVGQWNVIQFYRFVEGANGTMAGGTANWDGTSANWQNRWTGTGELYPWKSFLEALNLRTRQATCVHPAQMGNLWGRVPPSPHG